MRITEKAALIAMTAIFALSMTGQVKAATNINLGAADAFAILAGSGITNTGATIISGDAGSSPTPTQTGFGPGANSITFASGTNHNDPDPNDASTQLAQTNLTTAYNNAAGQSSNQNLTGQDLGGLTLVSGTYTFSSSAQLTGTLTLNGQGNTNAVFIFQIGSTLTTASASRVLLINGAQSCHVFWQVGSSATLGTTTSFVGNILALTSVTLNTGATVDGRVLARNGSVTLDANTITASACGSGPAIVVSKTATPSVLTSGTGLVTYNYVVNNLGPTAISNITINDDKCTPVGFISGDTNSNSKLDTTETWNYSCTATLSTTTTNIVTVTGIASGSTATAITQLTVDVSNIDTSSHTGNGYHSKANTTSTKSVNSNTSVLVSAPTPKLPDTGFNSTQNKTANTIIAISTVLIVLISTVILRKKQII